MTKQQIIDLAASYGYKITDRCSAAYVCAHMNKKHGTKVTVKMTYEAWKAAQ